MATLKIWISAARPRTLPLSIAGILAGTGMAVREGLFDGLILLFALLTTLSLQILSNFANDYGDGVKGTDNEERVGPMRALQSGAITDKQMKNAMIWSSIISLVFAVILIFLAFNTDQFGYVLLFFILGIAAIAAAIKYTVGNTAYGYRGLGDIFVFLFFGLLSTVGCYFLYTHHLEPQIWVIGTIVGLLSTAVLNLNNMRDRQSDERSGKITLVVKMGDERAKRYHAGLLLIALAFTLIYNLKEDHSINWLLLMAFIPLLFHLRKVLINKIPAALDSELKKVALSTVFFALIYLATGFIY